MEVYKWNSFSKLKTECWRKCSRWWINCVNADVYLKDFTELHLYSTRHFLGRPQSIVNIC